MNFDEMTDLSKQLREKLKELCVISLLKINRKLVDKSDGTVKYLYELGDGAFIESVIMQYKHGKSVCISSQVGCRMGCKFCASTLNGKQRDLTAGEMIMQVAVAQREHGISHVVIMGVGEPLDNYDNLLKFLCNLNDTRGMNLGLRHVSLSTCGIVDKIYELANKRLQLILSISLHAPDDYTRNKIMPINKKWCIEELIDSCRVYIEKTNRRISFEYTLIDGVNDTPAHAQKLALLLKGMLCHVNLIPVNYVFECGFKPSGNYEVQAFFNVLEHHHITVTIRRTLGNEINASCGQLRYNGG